MKIDPSSVEKIPCINLLDYHQKETKTYTEQPHYFKTLNRCKCIEVPFIWSPVAINQIERDYCLEHHGVTDIQYKNRGPIKTIGIFEPNINIVKWAFPAVLVCENSYRSIPDKIKKVHITNYKHEKITFQKKLFNLLKPLDLLKDDKISGEGRFITMKFMASTGDIVVAHQWENPLNYIYLELAWMGWPIVHNAYLCKPALSTIQPKGCHTRVKTS